MGSLEGRVALVTGAARGQGRSHAIAMADEGADIIAVDICRDIVGLDYALADDTDMEQTVRGVEQTGRRIVAKRADVRNRAELAEAIREAHAVLGRLDIVCANAGISIMRRWNEVDERAWQTQIDVLLTGVWNTLAITAQYLIDAGGGSMIITASAASIKGAPYFAPYVAAKHGVVGLAKVLANELGQHRVRVNCVSPNAVDTKLLEGLGGFDGMIAGDEHFTPIFSNALPFDVVQPRDVSRAVLFLASDDSQFMTGHNLVMDMGNTIR